MFMIEEMKQKMSPRDIRMRGLHPDDGGGLDVDIPSQPPTSGSDGSEWD